MPTDRSARGSAVRRLIQAAHRLRRGFRRARKRLGVPLAIASALLIVYALATTVTAIAASSGGGSTPDYTTQPSPSPGAEVVKVGVEPITFDGVSVSDETFQTSFYVWWRWRGKIDPVPTTDVLNATPSSSSYVVSYSY
ncbi:MAG: hypothetical protein JWM71_1266, partial [Solirubrobacteraceae bacterium]|nr:hypothetical protein [Solirubrobacteraceae bacterium]